MARDVDIRTTAPVGAERRSPMQLAAGAVGVVFLLVGILGFVPGVTTNLDDITWVGYESRAELLGLFGVNVLHNIVHLAFGIAGIAMARTAYSARTYLLVGGAVYLVLWFYGLIVDLNGDWNFVALNVADNWLHAGLGVGMITLGVAVPNERSRLAA